MVGSRSSRQPTFRALVVDDEAPLAEVVASYLEREQFEMSIAGNGTDAIIVARELDPDVVILATRRSPATPIYGPTP